MSKMSQAHAELSEQAYDLGYESLQAAMDDGCETAYFCGDPVLFKRKHKSTDPPFIHNVSLNEAMDEAHREFEMQRAYVLHALDELYEWHLQQSPDTTPKNDVVNLLTAIEFVKGVHF